MHLLELFLYFHYFLICAFVAFYIPGSVLLSRFKLSRLQKIVLALVLGMVLWGWQGFVFGFLNVRFLTYVYIATFFIFWLRSTRFRLPKIRKIPRLDPLLTAIFIIGVLIQVSILFLMGIRTDSELTFCCGAVGDFLYHTRLTDQVLNKIPPFEPDMYGTVVTNYHYLGNIVVAELVRIFRLPLVFTQFQYMGLLLSVLLGTTALVFSQLHKWKIGAQRWLLFFLFFGGDFIYILLLALGKGLQLEMGPLENGAAFLNNPPRAFAIVAFFAGISLFSLWIKKKDMLSGLLTGIVFASLVGFKIYIGIFALVGLCPLGLYALIARRSYLLLPIVLTILLSLIMYLPVNIDAGGLRFTGFWRFEEFIVQPALGLSHLEQARGIFAADNKWHVVLFYDLLFMALFIFAIFGPKLIGLFQTRKSLSLLPFEVHLFLFSGLIVSFIAGSFFWQKSGGSNSFNFLVSVYIIGSIYAAIASYHWFGKIRNKKLMAVCIFVFAFLNVPRIFYEEYKNIGYIKRGEGHVVAQPDLEAFDFVRKNTSVDALFVVGNARYHTFLTNRNIFLGDIGLLRSHDVDTSEQRKVQETILAFKEPTSVQKLIKEKGIDYLYLPIGEQTISTQSAGFFENVYENASVRILKVR